MVSDEFDEFVFTFRLVGFDEFHDRHTTLRGRDAHFAVEFVEWSAGVCHDSEAIGLRPTLIDFAPSELFENTLSRRIYLFLNILQKKYPPKNTFRQASRLYFLSFYGLINL